MLFNKKDRYCTIPEYLEMIRQEEAKRKAAEHIRAEKIRASMTKKEIKEFDTLIGERIMKDQKVKKAAVMLMGILMYCKDVAVAQAPKMTNAEAMDRLDKKGWEVLDIIRKGGFWLCVIMCSFEILKALAKGDSKDITRIVIKYILGFGALYAIPWVFEFIVGLFT